MNLIFYIDGNAATEEQALRAFAAYEARYNGTPSREAIAIFDRALAPTEDGEDARETLLDAGVEIVFA